MGKLKSVGEASRPETQVGVDATVLRQKLFFSTKSQACALRPSAYREDQPDEGGSSPLQKSADCDVPTSSQSSGAAPRFVSA